MEIRAVKFRVARSWRVGGLYRPSAVGPTPGVLLLHGFPGVQQNEDMAAELCRRGVTALVPHFRGCWGSGGRFSIPGLFQDARAALELLSRYHQVDPGRVGLLGYSVGGWVALRLAAEFPVAAVAALAPAVPHSDASAEEQYLRRNSKVLHCRPPERIREEYRAAARADHPDAYLRHIVPAPILFVQGLKDRLVSPGATAGLHSLAREPKRLLEFPGEDHEFQADRPAVVAAVCDWLEGALAATSTGADPAAGANAEEPAGFLDFGVCD